MVGSAHLNKVTLVLVRMKLVAKDKHSVKPVHLI